MPKVLWEAHVVPAIVNTAGTDGELPPTLLVVGGGFLATRRGQSSLISLTTFQMKLTSRFLTVTGSNSGFSGMR